MDNESMIKDKNKEILYLHKLLQKKNEDFEGYNL